MYLRVLSSALRFKMLRFSSRSSECTFFREYWQGAGRHMAVELTAEFVTEIQPMWLDWQVRKPSSAQRAAEVQNMCHKKLKKALKTRLLEEVKALTSDVSVGLLGPGDCACVHIYVCVCVCVCC